MILPLIMVNADFKTGPYTQIFVMTPVGCNLVFLVEGQKRKLPSPRESSDLLIDLISIIWKCHVGVPSSFYRAQGLRIGS